MFSDEQPEEDPSDGGWLLQWGRLWPCTRYPSCVCTVIMWCAVCVLDSVYSILVGVVVCTVDVVQSPRSLVCSWDQNKHQAAQAWYSYSIMEYWSPEMFYIHFAKSTHTLNILFINCLSYSKTTTTGVHRLISPWSLSLCHQVLGQEISDFPLPDLALVAEHSDPVELGRLLQLILGCAVRCERKQGMWLLLCYTHRQTQTDT